MSPCCEQHIDYTGLHYRVDRVEESRADKEALGTRVLRRTTNLMDGLDRVQMTVSSPSQRLSVKYRARTLTV